MTEIMVDLHAIINAKIRVCLLENDRLIKIMEDESIPFEDRLGSLDKAVENIEMVRQLCGQEIAFQMELANLKYAADKAAIERWAENKKKELLEE